MNTTHTDTGLLQDITSVGQQCGQGPGPLLSSGQQDGPTALQRGLCGHLDGADDTWVAGQGHHPLLQAVHQPWALAQSQTLHILRLRDGCMKLQKNPEKLKTELLPFMRNSWIKQKLMLFVCLCVCLSLSSCLYVCVSVYHNQFKCFWHCSVRFTLKIIKNNEPLVVSWNALWGMIKVYWLLEKSTGHNPRDQT